MRHASHRHDVAVDQVGHELFDVFGVRLWSVVGHSDIVDEDADVQLRQFRGQSAVNGNTVGEIHCDRFGFYGRTLLAWLKNGSNKGPAFTFSI